MLECASMCECVHICVCVCDSAIQYSVNSNSESLCKALGAVFIDPEAFEEFFDMQVF